MCVRSSLAIALFDHRRWCPETLTPACERHRHRPQGPFSTEWRIPPWFRVSFAASVSPERRRSSCAGAPPGRCPPPAKSLRWIQATLAVYEVQMLVEGSVSQAIMWETNGKFVFCCCAKKKKGLFWIQLIHNSKTPKPNNRPKCSVSLTSVHKNK